LNKSAFSALFVDVDDRQLSSALEEAFRPKRSPSPPERLERAASRYRRHRQALGVAVALAITAVVGAGLATALGGRGSERVATAPPPTTTTPGAPQATGWALLFKRSTSGVRVAAYLTPHFLGEVSNASAVADLGAAAISETCPPPPPGVKLPPGGVKCAGVSVVDAVGFGLGPGEAEGLGDDRAYAVAVRALNVPVTSVTLLEGGREVDRMRPVQGWAILAGRGHPSEVTVVARTASGREVARLSSVIRQTPALPRPLFLRSTADGVRLRGYVLRGFFAPLISNDGAVDQFEGLQPCRPTDPIGLAFDGAFPQGTQEGAPMTIVVAHAGTAVARVRVRFSDGVTDEMEPAEGQVALGRQGNVEGGVIDALDAKGAVIRSLPLGAPRDPTCQ
jgi:hypothetical protein